MAEARKTAVVTDSTSYLPADLVEREGISVVSLYVTIEGETRAEVEIDDFAGFFERLRRSGEAPTTSQPSVGDFIDVYEPLLDEGLEIVSLHLSAGISGTCESARQAVERLTAEGKGGERIRLFDSRSTAGGLGMCVLSAAAAAHQGAGADEVLSRAQRAREGMKIWFAVDTLEYLRRGGRIGAASAWVGTALKVKPILTLEEQVEPVERVRTSSRAYARLVDYARECRDRGTVMWALQHIQDRAGAERMEAECREIFGFGPVFIGEIGPVIGAHAGPGLLGVGAISGVEP